MKQTVKDLNLSGKKVLLRCDFNVPLEGKRITDATRIKEEIPNLEYILNEGASVVMCSHLGRPDGERIDKYSLRPVFEYLEKLYGDRIIFIDDFKSKEGKAAIKALKPGEMALLENLRFYKEEEKNDKAFSKELAKPFDVYVNDAFGTAHRKHASTYGVAAFLKQNAVGFLIEKELKMITEKINNPARPFVAILGGSKVKDKIKVIKSLIERADTLLIGGGIAYTFMAAKGISIGTSILDETNINFAKEMLDYAKQQGKKLLLPVDVVCAKKKDDTKTITIEGNIPEKLGGFDIGPKTIEEYVKEIKKAGLIVWNGPVGAYEFKPFLNGTESLARAVANSKGESIIGGGDVVSAVTNLGLDRKITHISTGGGASLTLLEGDNLVALDAIKER